MGFVRDFRLFTLLCAAKICFLIEASNKTILFENFSFQASTKNKTNLIYNLTYLNLI